MAAGMHFIDVLSDSTGGTAERVVRAALLQFPRAEVVIRRHSRVRTPEAAGPILERAAKDGSLLLYSVVDPALSAFIDARSRELRADAIDVIGSVVGALSGFLGAAPLARPGTLLPLSEEYFRRVEALTFTVKNDGGRDPGALSEADLVLVGVSRTSKTAISTLLAQRGLKVMNLTLALNTEPPGTLFERQRPVVGLTIDSQRLCEIRQDRLRKLGMPNETQYAMRAHVEREVERAEALFARYPHWPVLDTTGKNIEDSAVTILDLVEKATPLR
ncbi:MAG: pyruvate, water dikinase regulatory protein [Myxococcota bacterium]